MSVRYSRYIPLIALSGDFFILNLMFTGLTILYKGLPEAVEIPFLFFYIYLNISWLILAFIFKAHQITPDTKKKIIAFRYVRIIVFFFVMFLLYLQVTLRPYYDGEHIKLIFPLFFLMIILWKYTLHYAFVIYRKLGYNYRSVLIIGINHSTRQLQRYFMSSALNGYRFIGYISDKKDQDNRVIGTWQEIKKVIEKYSIDEVYLSWESIPAAYHYIINEIVTEYPVKIRIVPELGNLRGLQAELINYSDIPVIQVHPGPLSFWYNRFIKRLFDLLISILVITLVLSWLIPLLLLLTLFGTREGIFFRQLRTGLNGKKFMVLKLRSMHQNPDADLLQASENDHRITPVGKFLRKTSLDELPQFFNVFMGQMSVIGPRPHMLKHTEEYRTLAKKFMMRHAVKPGITGLAQVHGYRGGILNQKDLTERVNLDVRYVENWSVGLDVRIILLTIKELIKGQRKAY